MVTSGNIKFGRFHHAVGTLRGASAESTDYQLSMRKLHGASLLQVCFRKFDTPLRKRLRTNRFSGRSTERPYGESVSGNL